MPLPNDYPDDSEVSEQLARDRAEALAAVHAALEPEYQSDLAGRQYGATYLELAADRIIREGNANTVRAVRDIVVDSQLDGVALPPLLGRFGPGDATYKKTRLLQLYEVDQEFTRTIVARHIAGFHASASPALISILQERALLSRRESAARGITPMTGELMWAAETSISFTDWRDVPTLQLYTTTEGVQTLEGLQARRAEVTAGLGDAANEYGADSIQYHGVLSYLAALDAQIGVIGSAAPDSDEAFLVTANFPVVFGLDASGYELDDTMTMPKPVMGEAVTLRTSALMGPVGEFLALGGRVSIEHLPVVAVPAQYMERVRQILQRYGMQGITVRPLGPLLSGYEQQFQAPSEDV